MLDPAEALQERAGREAFAALLRERIPDYGRRGALEEFAGKCGGNISGPQVGTWARGEATPTLTSLRYLCQGMGVPLLHGFSVLAGLEPAESVPPPSDLHQISIRINEAADLMNRLMVRSTRREHMRRRHPRPRDNGSEDGTSEPCAQYNNRMIDCKSDYNQQADDNNHRNVLQLPKHQTRLTRSPWAQVILPCVHVRRWSEDRALLTKAA